MGMRKKDAFRTFYAVRCRCIFLRERFRLHYFLHVHAYNPGGFVVQHHTKWCGAGTMLSTADECNNAKAVLDPGADRVTIDNHKGAPKGCSRHKGTWYFNTHARGALDGESEPVCKASAGY